MSPRVKILYGILNSRSIFQGVKIPYDTGTNNRFNYGFLLLCLLVGQENRYIYIYTYIKTDINNIQSTQIVYF